MMTKREAYAIGAWQAACPPVCTARWGEADWIRWIDANGRWLVPITDCSTCG